MHALLRWGFFIVWMTCANVQAAPILQVDVNGILTGATGVDVGGTLYDVEFVDGTCGAVFSGCTSAASFTFTTLPSAEAASRALLDQVFLDVAAGMFDTFPSLTSGCPEPRIELCQVLTPFDLSPSGALVLLGGAINSAPPVEDRVGEFFIESDRDVAANRLAVWARWTPTALAVPEPGTIPCLGVGLLAVALALRRRTQPRARTQ
jgi:hypothetical protein